MKKIQSSNDETVKFLLGASPVQNDKLKNLASREESLMMSLLLSDKDLIADAVESGVTSSCFQNTVTKRMFEMAAEHFDRHQNLLTRPALDSMLASVSSPEEAAMFRSKYDTIVAEFGVKASDYPMLKDNMEGRFVQRQAVAICKKFLDELVSSTRDQKQLVSKFQNFASEISAFGDAQSFVEIANMQDVMDRLGQELIDRRDNPGNYVGIRCGYPKIDADYNGFVRRRYMVITATEGGGKTTLMLNLARNFALNGNSVVYVTIESGNLDIGRRILTMQSKVSYNRVMRGGNSTEYGLAPYIMSELNSSRDYLSSHVNKNFHFIQVLENTSREQICRLVQRVRAYNPVDVVFIDYLGVVGKEVNFGERADLALADVSGKFRAWGRASNLLLITANQIKSDKGRKLQERVKDEDDIMIVKGDTSGSKEISGAADYMFGCWIPLSRDRMVVYSTKTRMGKDTQKYTLSYDPESGRIDSMGEFGDVDTVAKVVADPSERQRIRKQFAAGDDASIIDVPGVRSEETPPNEIVRAGIDCLPDALEDEDKSFLDS